MERFKQAIYDIDSLLGAVRPRLPHGLHQRLWDITQGKACLLCELPTSALHRLDAEFPGHLPGLLSLRERAIQVVGVSKDPLRYVPAGVHAMASLSGISFADFARHCRPSSWSWFDVLVARGPISADGFAVAMQYIFEESKHVNQAPHYFPAFKDRLAHSDCLHLCPPWLPEVDLQDVAEWSGPPSKRIKLMASSVAQKSSVFIDPSKWRFPGLLAREAALRTACRSIMASWKSYRSGIRAWANFMLFLFPFSDPFIVDTDMVIAFSSAFQMASTFKEYYGHVRFGVRMLGLSLQTVEPTVQQVIRGCRKGRPGRRLHRLRRSDVKHLVYYCIDKGRRDMARFFVIARVGLFRVASELLPLQPSGREHLDPASVAWHSYIRLDTSNRSVTIHLRKRKCHPEGASITRHCSCKDEPDLFCFYHAIKDQINWDQPRQPIWNFNLSQLITFFKAALAACDLPTNSGLHAFRRGMASDLVASGSSLSFILHAGGWRSSAFMKYVSASGLDEREAVDFAIAESDSEED